MKTLPLETLWFSYEKAHADVGFVIESENQYKYSKRIKDTRSRIEQLTIERIVNLTNNGSETFIRHLFSGHLINSRNSNFSLYDKLINDMSSNCTMLIENQIHKIQQSLELDSSVYTYIFNSHKQSNDEIHISKNIILPAQQSKIVQDRIKFNLVQHIKSQIRNVDTNIIPQLDILLKDIDTDNIILVFSLLVILSILFCETDRISETASLKRETNRKEALTYIGDYIHNSAYYSKSVKKSYLKQPETETYFSTNPINDEDYQMSYLISDMISTRSHKDPYATVFSKICRIVNNIKSYSPNEWNEYPYSEKVKWVISQYKYNEENKLSMQKMIDDIFTGEKL